MGSVCSAMRTRMFVFGFLVGRPPLPHRASHFPLTFPPHPGGNPMEHYGRESKHHADMVNVENRVGRWFSGIVVWAEDCTT